MLFQRLVCSTLVCSVTIVPCLAQININPNRGYTPNRSAPTSILELRRRANAGDANAAYLLGRNCEVGSGTSSNRPDLKNAIAWYNIAIRGGSLPATYRLGQLMVGGQALAPAPGGGYRADMARGQAMMRYAVAHGFSPQTGMVTPPVRTAQQIAPPASSRPPAPSSSSSGDDAAVGALLLGLGALAVFAAAASNSSSSSSGSSLPGNDQATKTCTIFYDVPITPDPTYPGTTTEQRSRTGYGYECP